MESKVYENNELMENLNNQMSHHVVPKIASEFRNLVLAKKFGNTPEDADR